MTTANQINVYDISVEARVALRDLLVLNPAIVPDTSLAPGTQLARPCYLSGAPTYFGADMAQVRRHPVPQFPTLSLWQYPALDRIAPRRVERALRHSAGVSSIELSCQRCAVQEPGFGAGICLSKYIDIVLVRGVSRGSQRSSQARPATWSPAWQ